MKLEDVSTAIEQNALVECSFGKYRLTGIVTRFNKKNGWNYTLELKDLKANSLVYAPLEDVKICKESL